MQTIERFRERPMHVGHWLAAIIAAFLLAVPAAAQERPPPAPYDPDAVLVEELVVTARDGGPAWWTVSDADSTVYILGAPSLAPERMQWDRSLFERRLEGATQVIVPFQDVKVSLTGALGAAFNMLRLRSSKPFEEFLEPVTRARFVAAREKLGQPASRYKTRNPLAAALLMTIDYRDRSHLTNSDPTKLIKVVAKEAGVPVIQTSYDLGRLLGRVIRTSPAAGMACLGEVLQQVEAGPGVTLDAARAWAAGDVHGALTNERTYERCIAAVPGAREFDDQVKTDQTAAIAHALQRPGHAIAVVQLRPLLSQGGVLDRLRAEGYVIGTPDET